MDLEQIFFTFGGLVQGWKTGNVLEGSKHSDKRNHKNYGASVRKDNVEVRLCLWESGDVQRHAGTYVNSSIFVNSCQLEIGGRRTVIMSLV